MTMYTKNEIDSIRGPLTELGLQLDAQVYRASCAQQAAEAKVVAVRDNRSIAGREKLAMMEAALVASREADELLVLAINLKRLAAETSAAVDAIDSYRNGPGYGLLAEGPQDA